MNDSQGSNSPQKKKAALAAKKGGQNAGTIQSQSTFKKEQQQQLFGDTNQADESKKKKNDQCWDEFKNFNKAIVEHWSVQVLMTIITLYALLGEDIKLLSTTMESDPIFVTLTSISLVLFLIELLLQSIGKEGYLNSFFFWLDLVSTLSLVMDIPFILELFTGDEDSTTQGDKNQQAQTSKYARASRGARIGTKAGRLTRVIRLIRLIRIVKLYKAYGQVQERREQKVKEKKNMSQTEIAIEELKLQKKRSQGQMDEHNTIPEDNESKVGKKLSDQTTKKVVILVLVMLFSQPLFAVSTYITEPDSYRYGLSLCKELGPLTPAGKQVFEDIKLNQVKLETPLIKLGIKLPYKMTEEQWGTEYYYQNTSPGNDPDLLRDVEKEVIQIYVDNGNFTGTLNPREPDEYEAFYDLRVNVQLEATLSIITTFMVCIVLGSGAMIFSKLTQDLVISPIENMIAKVQAITKDPLKAAHEEEEKLLFIELAEKEAFEDANKSAKGTANKVSFGEKKGPMETAMLESTLSKIGALLALGFGEAGSAIIAKNMEKGDDVNPMLPGIKEMYIFGFCDIRCFTDATEVLQEGVMLFVNEIGEIVHGTVDRYSGAANKNIGDAFLLVWKFIKEDQYYDSQTDSIQIKNCSRVNQLADMSAISFILLVSGLKKSRKMVKYDEHVGLNQRMPGYQVKLGLGLHIGYAIEGAIGSYYKIDASYLSSHVRMAERLEGSTKHYGVPLLISETLHRKFTRKTKGYCRTVDYCVMAGNPKPVRLFTIDINSDKIPLEEELPYMNPKQKKIQRVHDRMKRNNLREAAFKNEVQISSLFESNADIAIMRKPFTKQFLGSYERGFNDYVKGNWTAAIASFEEAKTVIPNDKPIKNILDFMSETNNVPPADWQGHKACRSE